jgi:divalent metal cation (Fe/Co/Zn/Cd) transporter
MDKSIDDEYKEEIIQAINCFNEVSGYHFLKTRRSGKKNFIEFHIVFKDIKISLKEAHIIGDKIEMIILDKIPHSHITIHLDYFDDSYSSDNPKLKTR